MVPDVRCVPGARLLSQLDDLLGEPPIGGLAELQPRVGRLTLATSYLPAELVRGSAITQQDTGPGGTYARLAELGHAPTHFREDLRARMPQPEETDALDLPSAGTPVIDIVRTAYTDAGQPVEVNEMTLDASAYILRYDFTA
jgi:GntR family transcriptional regulator